MCELIFRRVFDIWNHCVGSAWPSGQMKYIVAGCNEARLVGKEIEEI